MSYKNKYDEIKTLPSRQRGFEFEKLINKICDDKGILISNSYKTVDLEQQIDGAIEIHKAKIFLIEAKWEESSTLAASKLFSFLGKVNSKIEGTLGLFISHNELSDNFISSVRNGLRQNCIIIHGEENIKDIIEKNVSIEDFIWYVFQQASTKNRSSINTSEFQSIPKVSAQNVNNNWNQISQVLLSPQSIQIFTVTLEDLYSSDIELSKKTLNIFSVSQADSLMQQKYLILVKKCINEESDVFKKELLFRLKSKHWKEYVEYPFLENIKEYITEISETERTEILNNAISHLEKYQESYQEENYASILVDFLFSHLTTDEINKLANAYLGIYCDDFRKDKFIQKQMANKIFRHLNEKELDVFEVVKPTILSRLVTAKRDEFYYESEDKEWSKRNSISRVSYKYAKVLDIDKLEVLKSEYDKL